MLRVVLQVIRRDLLLAARQKADVLNTLFFFVVVVTMVPLGEFASMPSFAAPPYSAASRSRTLARPTPLPD